MAALPHSSEEYGMESQNQSGLGWKGFLKINSAMAMEIFHSECLRETVKLVRDLERILVNICNL